MDIGFGLWQSVMVLLVPWDCFATYVDHAEDLFVGGVDLRLVQDADLG